MSHGIRAYLCSVVKSYNKEVRGFSSSKGRVAILRTASLMRNDGRGAK